MRSPSHSHTSSQRHSDLDRRPRRGAVVVMAALFMVALLGMVAFAVDLGYIMKVQTDLDRSVDAAVLAGAGELVRGQQYAEDRMFEYLARNPIGPQVAVTEVNLPQLKNEFVQLQGKNGDDGNPLLQLNVGRWDDASGAVVPVSGSQKPSAVGLALTHANHPYFFGRVFGQTTFAVQSSAVAIYQPRDIMLVLDYSASMNDDSELSSIGDLGKTHVINNLQEIYQDLGSPVYGKMTFQGTSITDTTNATTLKTRLGLTNVPYPYSSGGSWDNYFNYVQTSSVVNSAGYRKKYGYLTLINYWLEKYPAANQVPVLWKTREQPITALKDSVSVFLDYLQEHETDDRLGLVVYNSSDGKGKLEAQLTTNFDSIDSISKQRQAGHYHQYTNIGGGLRKAYDQIKNDGGFARPNACRMIVLMTDGLANYYNGGVNESAARQDLLNAALSCKNDGIPVITICLGAGADTDVMEQVAELTGGRSFVVPGGQTGAQYAAELTEVFKAIADSRPLRLVH